MIKETSVRKTSILLVDDNPAVLEQVSNLLKRDQEYEVVAKFDNGATVLEQYALIRPDVVVLDISMGATSGIDVAAHLRDSGYQCKIVFLSVHEDVDFVNAAIGAGGSAYVVKSRISTDLILAIDAVLTHKLFVSPTLLYAHL